MFYSCHFEFIKLWAIQFRYCFEVFFWNNFIAQIFLLERILSASTCMYVIIFLSTNSTSSGGLCCGGGAYCWYWSGGTGPKHTNIIFSPFNCKIELLSFVFQAWYLVHQIPNSVAICLKIAHWFFRGFLQRKVLHEVWPHYGGVMFGWERAL